MKKKLMIEGMSCNHCVMRVKGALKELEGVTSVDVNLEGKYALVESDGEIADAKLQDAVDDAGYDVVKVEKL